MKVGLDSQVGIADLGGRDNSFEAAREVRAIDERTLGGRSIREHFIQIKCGSGGDQDGADGGKDAECHVRTPSPE